MMFPQLVKGYARLRKDRISKGTNRNRYDARNGVHPIEDGGTTIWTEVIAGCSALIAYAGIFVAMALDFHVVNRESGLRAKHTAGTLLARQAVAN